jgi:hypothetical protein
MSGLFVPYEISNLALQYSIPLFFISGFVSMFYGQKILGFMQWIVYVTSILHWSHINKYGMIRYLDMGCAILLVMYASYVSTYLIPNIKYMWYRSITISISIFIINEFVFFIGVDYCQDKTYLYYQAVIVHMIFLHILPTITMIYCLMKGNKNIHN